MPKDCSTYSSRFVSALSALVLTSTLAASAHGQAAGQKTPAASAPGSPTSASPAADVPAEYVIGPEDVIGVNFWKDTEMTGDYPVRPDGRITLPLIGDIQAAGLSPEALKEVIQKAALKFQQDPTVTIIVRQINSRKVYITGQV